MFRFLCIVLLAVAATRLFAAVAITREGDVYVLDNGKVALKVPAVAADAAPAPVLGIRPAGQEWLGAGRWVAAPTRQAFVAVVDGETVKLRYTFAEERTAEFWISLAPDQPVATIEEAHSMRAGDAWAFDLHPGWAPTEGIIRGWLHAAGPHDSPTPGPDPRTVPLQPGARLGATLAYLQPRWTQNCDAAWCFAATDGATLLGAIPVRLSKWLWPYDNLLEVRAPETGQASLVCPAQRGRRFWLLLAGERALLDRTRDLASRYSGVGFQPFDSGINPSGGGIRGPGRTLAADIKAGKLPKASIEELRRWFSPDVYGLYYNHWSPINPNFATDYLKVGILKAVGCRDNPEARKLAEEAFRMDLDHSVTLPGGAGQECPGYLVHAMKQWLEMAPICKEYLGFDPREWPRMKAAASFLIRTRPPGRSILPMGDTHPTGYDLDAIAKALGVPTDTDGLGTEELPGFGVVFRGNGTWLAFKAGPNRGHMHGDQLSFHGMGCVDHQCSYDPRADQEHMHNRLAFAPLDWDYANMDGHERLIAFNTTPCIDVAIGQVESMRLRKQRRLPPAVWQDACEKRAYEEPLVYRRTIVQVKGGPGKDYFVIRDQYTGPEVKVAYCLHGLSQVSGVTPKDAKYEPFDWSFTAGKGGRKESTKGMRLNTTGTAVTFITVLGAKGPATATATGVRVGDDEIEFREAPGDPQTPIIVLRRGAQEHVGLIAAGIDLNRNQGDVGLFVPEAGYDFGPIPDWLLKQRTNPIRDGAWAK